LTEEHKTQEGLEIIIAYKGCFPKGLNDKLREAFPDVVLRERPEWLATRAAPLALIGLLALLMQMVQETS